MLETSKVDLDITDVWRNLHAHENDYKKRIIQKPIFYFFKQCSTGKIDMYQTT